MKTTWLLLSSPSFHVLRFWFGAASCLTLSSLAAAAHLSSQEAGAAHEEALSHEDQSDDYRLTLETPGSARKDAPMDVEVHIVAKNGKKINVEYPARLRVEHPDLWELNEASSRLAVEGGKKPVRATLLGAVKPKKSGSQVLSVKVSFSVCTDEQCLIEKVVLSDRIEVK